MARKSVKLQKQEWLNELKSYMNTDDGEGHQFDLAWSPDFSEITVYPYKNNQPPLTIGVNLNLTSSNLGAVPIVGTIQGKGVDSPIGGVPFNASVVGTDVPEVVKDGRVIKKEKIDVDLFSGTQSLASGIISAFQKAKENKTTPSEEFSTITSNISGEDKASGSNISRTSPKEAQDSLVNRIMVHVNADRFKIPDVRRAIFETILGERDAKNAKQSEQFFKIAQSVAFPDKQGNLQPLMGRGRLFQDDAAGATTYGVILPAGAKGSIYKPSLERGGAALAFPLASKRTKDGKLTYERVKSQPIIEGEAKPHYAKSNVLGFGGEREDVEVERILFTATNLPGAAYRFYDPSRTAVDAYGRDDAVLKARLPFETFTPETLLSKDTSFDFSKAEDEGQHGFGSRVISLGEVSVGGKSMQMTTQKGENPFFSAEGGRTMMIPKYWNPKTKQWAKHADEGAESTKSLAKSLSRKFGIPVVSGGNDRVLISQKGSVTGSARNRGEGSKWLEALTGSVNMVNVGGRDVALNLMTAEAKTPALDLALFKALSNEQQSSLVDDWVKKQEGTSNYAMAVDVQKEIARQFRGGSGMPNEPVALNLERVADIAARHDPTIVGRRGLASRIVQETIISDLHNDEANERNLRLYEAGWIKPHKVDVGPFSQSEWDMRQSEIRRKWVEEGKTEEDANKFISERFSYGKKETDGTTPILEFTHLGGFVGNFGLPNVMDNDTSRHSASGIFQEAMSNLSPELARSMGVHPSQGGSLTRHQEAAVNLMSYLAFEGDRRKGIESKSPFEREVTDDQALALSNIPTDIEGKAYAEKVSEVLGYDKDDLTTQPRIGKRLFMNPNVVANEQFLDMEGLDVGGLGSYYRSSVSSTSKEQLYPEDVSSNTGQLLGASDEKPNNAMYMHVFGMRKNLIKQIEEKEVASGFRGSVAPFHALESSEVSIGSQILNSMAGRIASENGLGFQQVAQDLMLERFGVIQQRDPGAARGESGLTVGENIPMHEIAARVGPERWARMQTDWIRSGNRILSGSGAMAQQQGDMDSDTVFGLGVIKYANKMFNSPMYGVQFDTPESIRRKELSKYPNMETANQFNAYVGSAGDLFSQAEKGVDPYTKNNRKLLVSTYKDMLKAAEQKSHPEAPIGKAYGEGQTFSAAQSVLFGTVSDTNFESNYQSGLDLSEYGEPALAAAVSSANLSAREDSDKVYFGYSTPRKDGENGPRPTNRVFLEGASKPEFDAVNTKRGLQTFMTQAARDFTAIHPSGHYLNSPDTLSALFGMGQDDAAEIKSELEATTPENYVDVLTRRITKHYRAEGSIDEKNIAMARTPLFSGLVGRAIGKNVKDPVALQVAGGLASAISGGNAGEAQRLMEDWTAIGVQDQGERGFQYLDDSRAPTASEMSVVPYTENSSTSNVFRKIGITPRDRAASNVASLISSGSEATPLLPFAAVDRESGQVSLSQEQPSAQPDNVVAPVQNSESEESASLLSQLAQVSTIKYLDMANMTHGELAEWEDSIDAPDDIREAATKELQKISAMSDDERNAEIARRDNAKKIASRGLPKLSTASTGGTSPQKQPSGETSTGLPDPSSQMPRRKNNSGFVSRSEALKALNEFDATYRTTKDYVISAQVEMANELQAMGVEYDGLGNGISGAIRSLTPEQATKLRAKYAGPLRQAKVLEEQRRRAFAFTAAAKVDPADARVKEQMDLLHGSYKDEELSSRLKDMGTAGLGLRAGEKGFNEIVARQALEMQGDPDVANLYAELRDLDIVGTGAQSKDFSSKMEKVLQDPSKRGVLRQTLGSMKALKGFGHEYMSQEQMELGKVAEAVVADKSLGAAALKDSKPSEKLDMTSQALERLSKTTEEYTSRINELNKAKESGDKGAIRSLEIEKEKAEFEQKKAFASFNLQVANQQKTSAFQEMQEQAAGGYVDFDTYKKYMKAVEDSDKHSERLGAIDEEELSRSYASRENSIGGAARKIIGGFGLMYARSILGFATGGFGEGYEENLKMRQSHAASQYNILGIGKAPIDQGMVLENIRAVNGSNSNGMLGIQTFLAENKNLGIAANLTGAGLASAAYADFFLNEMPGVDKRTGKFNALQGTASSGLTTGGAAIGVAGLTIAANVLGAGYERTQDPVGLGARVGRGDASFIDYVGAGELAVGSIFGSETSWDKIQETRKYQLLAENVSRTGKGSRSLGSNYLVGGDSYFNYSASDNARVMQEQIQANNPVWSSEVAGTMGAMSQKYGWDTRIIGERNALTSIAEDFQMGGRNMQAGAVFASVGNRSIAYSQERLNVVTGGWEGANLSDKDFYDVVHVGGRGGGSTKTLKDGFIEKDGEIVNDKTGERYKKQEGGGYEKYNASMTSQMSRSEAYGAWLSEAQNKNAGDAGYLSKEQVDRFQAIVGVLNSLSPKAAEGLGIDAKDQVSFVDQIKKHDYMSDWSAYQTQEFVGYRNAYSSLSPSSLKRFSASGKMINPENWGSLTDQQIHEANLDVSGIARSDQKWENILLNLSGEANFYGDADLASSITKQFSGLQEKNKGGAAMFMNRAMSGDQEAWTAMGLQGVNYGSLNLPTIDGQRYDSSYLSMIGATDIGMNGKMTGMDWGQTSLQSASPFGGIVTADQNAIKFFGQGWQKNGQFSSDLINSMIGGQTLDAPIQTATGTITQVGGIQGAQLYMNRQAEQFQLENLYRSQKAQDLDYAYTMKSWKLQDKGRNLSNAYQEWQFDFQDRQIEMNSRNFSENMGMNVYQSHVQRGWAKEDWAHNDNVRALNWQWKTDDFNEEVRFMTGRERKKAERGMDRDTIMHNLDEQQVDKQKGRQQELWKLEDKRFEIQRRQFAESQKMQLESLEKQKELFVARKGMEEQEIKFQREHYKQQTALQKEATRAQIEYTKVQAANQRTMQQMQLAMTLNQASQRTLADGWQTLSQKMMVADDQLRLLAESLTLVAQNAAAASSHPDDDDYNPYEYTPGGGRNNRATGGNVLAGERLVVNEIGEEIFIPDTNGKIIPSWRGGSSSASFAEDYARPFIPFDNSSSGSPKQIAVNVYLGNDRIEQFIIDTVTGELK